VVFCNSFTIKLEQCYSATSASSANKPPEPKKCEKSIKIKIKGFSCNVKIDQRLSGISVQEFAQFELKQGICTFLFKIVFAESFD
jgi:hypothetical protein